MPRLPTSSLQLNNEEYYVHLLVSLGQFAAKYQGEHGSTHIRKKNNKMFHTHSRER